MKGFPKYIAVLSFMMWVFAQSVSAQVVTLTGKVVDVKGLPLPGIHIQIKPNMLSTTSGTDGAFTFNLPNNGTYTIRLSGLGFEVLEQTVQVSASNRHFNVVLKATINEIESISIVGKTETQSAKEQLVRASVVDLKDTYSRPSTLIELMNQNAGVRIRQTGGLGARSDVSLNGFQGKSIKYFKDGIPLDYLGEGFELSALPSNMLQRIEVYKGVLPVSLGADALGGAVNLVTRRPAAKYLELGYELASFNTHRFNLNTYLVNKKQTAFLGVDAFVNSSDNNYKALVNVIDPVTRNPYQADVPLFHNAFNGYFAQLYGGFQNRTWTDELRFELSLFNNKREQQHPALMSDPYGALLSKQSSVIPSLTYKKKFFDDRLHVNQFMVYNTLNTRRIDTLRGQYDWFGNFTSNDLKLGESRQPSDADIDVQNFVSRTNLKFQWSDKHEIEFNNVFASARRLGTDPLGARFSGTDVDVLSVASTYKKWVSSLGISSNFLNNKLNHVLVGKFFSYSASGIEAYEAKPVFSNEKLTIDGFSWGIADALKYTVNKNSIVRFSVEYANRLPDQNELFGDGIFVVPNFNLKPERSLNMNLGYRFNNDSKHIFEVNSFYRRTKNLILLVPIQQPYARFENQENVKGFGLELDGSMTVAKNLQLNMNATWQSLRLFDVSTANGGAEKNNARLRNTPYLFGNAGLNYRLEKTRFYANYNVVRAYFLETIPKRLEPGGFLGLGSTDAINSLLVIPDQHLLSAGLSHTFLEQKLTVGAELKNLLNNRLYDNYRIQKAGRSFHLKLNYTIR